jgi:cbb3-type cytochrome oxidase cytochrome c subunit
MRCHASGGGEMGGGGRGRGGRGRGPDLSRVGANPSHTVDWFMKFVRNPQSIKPDSRMPAFEEAKINEEDLRALAQYLASLKG